MGCVFEAGRRWAINEGAVCAFANEEVILRRVRAAEQGEKCTSSSKTRSPAVHFRFATGAVVWLEVCAACDALLQHAATPGRNCFYTRGLAQQQQGRERAGAVRI